MHIISSVGAPCSSSQKMFTCRSYGAHGLAYYMVSTNISPLWGLNPHHPLFPLIPYLAKAVSTTNYQHMTPTFSKDGHLFFKEIAAKPESILGDRLIINPLKIKESAVYAKKNSIKSITVNPAYFEVEDLNFLSEFPFIEGLYLLQDNLDLTPITKLSNLKVLTIGDVKPKIDLANLPNLEVLGITYSKHVLNLESCAKIFWIWLDNFKADNLEGLSALVNLQYLNLYKTSITDLAGIDNLHKLSYLRIDSANSLTSLLGISESNVSLKEVNINNTKNLVNYSSLANAASIEKVALRKTGELQDIYFLKHLKHLNTVAIDAKIINGDIRYLREIAEVDFLDFPHYNLKMKELKTP